MDRRDHVADRRRHLHRRDGAPGARARQPRGHSRAGGHRLVGAAGAAAARERRPLRPTRSPPPDDRGGSDPAGRRHHDRRPLDRGSADGADPDRPGGRVRRRSGALRSVVLGDRPVDRARGGARRGQRARSDRATRVTDADRSDDRRHYHGHVGHGGGVPGRRRHVRVVGGHDLADPGAHRDRSGRPRSGRVPLA